jgi:hypothetical protein
MKKAIDNIFGLSFMTITIPAFFVMVDASLLAASVCCACTLTLSAISFHSAQEG